MFIERSSKDVKYPRIHQVISMFWIIVHTHVLTLFSGYAQYGCAVNLEHWSVKRTHWERAEVEVNFVLISASIGFEGNELADWRFKSATTKEQISMAVTYKAKIKSQVKSEVKKKWQKQRE